MSVLNQDYPNIELIVVDDGSKDGTPDAAEKFDRRVKVLRQDNSGPAAARNRGIAAASGDFIAFLDADDIWLPGKLALQVQYLQAHPDVGVVFGGFLRWYPQTGSSFMSALKPENLDSPLKLVPEHSGWIYKDILLDSVICIITAMVRRSVIETVGSFDESLRTGEDYDFWLRVSRQFRTAGFDRTLAYYRMHAASTTRVA
ncbi:MAG: glycosyltransferase, partial [Oxalobacteraceae bacterium]